MANQTYFCTLTAVGEAKDANAKALGTALKLTEMAVGDGNGALPIPDRARTSLVRQVRRAPLNTLKPDPLNPGQLIAEQIIPEDVGGWWIRELGIYDDAGDLIAIGNCPETYKPQLAEGSGRVQVVRMVLIMSSAATVQLKIDPAVVLATRKYADDQDAAHAAAADPHPQYLTEAEGAARIQAAVQALVNSSPATLDTLAELAAALNNDKDFAVTITNALALKAPKDAPTFTGNVGIGTNATTRLQVNGRISAGVLGVSGQYAISFNPDTAGSSIYHIKNANEVLSIVSGADPYSGASTEKIRVEGTGFVVSTNIGIGVSPTEKLHIADGKLKISSGPSSWFDIGGNVSATSVGMFRRANSAMAAGYLGTDGNGILSTGTGANFGIRAEEDLLLLAGATEAGRIDKTGNLLLGVSNGTYHNLRKDVPEGSIVAGFAGKYTGGLYVCRADVSGYNPAATAVFVDKNGTTNRSLNASGTINASGADYAEYMTKAPKCGAIQAGQIAGINADGQLVDTWADAVSFLVKSTNPSYVGGDSWGSPEALGIQRPVLPALQIAEYTGAPYPGQEPAAPAVPSGSAAADAETLYQEQLAKYQEAKATYDRALAAYQADYAAYAEKIESDRQDFDAITMPAYQVELAKFEQVLEAARQRVDRMAYCGQVPVNVTGAKPGQYVVPVQDGAGIAGQLVNADAITFDQYRRAVGIVQNILPDGRANVRVKPL